MNFLSTNKGTLLEGFYPHGWDFSKIDECCSLSPEKLLERKPFWHKNFKPVMCENIANFDTLMGHEIALKIKEEKDKGNKIAFILPAGPMGMYKWACFFLNEWKTSCDHVYCFNMDEWSDADGNTLPSTNPASFQCAMENAFYNHIEQTIPVTQRNFATKENLPTYPDKIATLKQEGITLILVFGIGRMCHIAFWEPHFAGEYKTLDEWKDVPYRIGAKLHPITIEQNAITSFKSRTSLVPCTANTIGPGIFLQADYIIGGADGAFPRGMQWQGMSFCMTLCYGPDPWVTSSFIPTMPGKLFFLKDLAGPLEAEIN